MAGARPLDPGAATEARATETEGTQERLTAARRAGAACRRAGRLVPHVPLTILVVAYAVRFSLLSVAVQDGYGTPAYDMGIFDQGIWLLSRFHAPFVTIMGRDLFGDHTSFILLLAVPLYWVYPHASALLVLQSCLLALAAVPIYLLARPRLGTWCATLLAAAYLLNPALQNGNLEQFHPEAFLVLTAAVAIYAALEWRPRLLGVAVVLSLLCKEDAALLIIPLGLWVAWRRDRAWGARIVVGALAYLFFATEVVIASLLGTAAFYANRVPFGGVSGTVRTLVEAPVRFWDYATGQGRLFYLWQLGVSVGFAFLRAPALAAVGILTLAVNVLSTFTYMHQILYHYSMPLVVVFVAGTVPALAALQTRLRRRVATVSVVCCALVSSILWGLLPFSLHSYPHWSPSSVAARDTTRALRALPPDAVVSAYFPYVAHIDHRARIYLWPTPFEARFWHLFESEGRPLAFTGQIRYLVLPTDLTGTDRALFDRIAPGYRIVSQVGDVAVYEQRAP